MRPPPLPVSSFRREKAVQVHMLTGGVGGGLVAVGEADRGVVPHGVQGLGQQAEEVSHTPPTLGAVGGRAPPPS